MEKRWVLFYICGEEWKCSCEDSSVLHWWSKQFIIVIIQFQIYDCVERKSQLMCLNNCVCVCVGRKIVYRCKWYLWYSHPKIYQLKMSQFKCKDKKRRRREAGEVLMQQHQYQQLLIWMVENQDFLLKHQQHSAWGCLYYFHLLLTLLLLELLCVFSVSCYGCCWCERLKWCGCYRGRKLWSFYLRRRLQNGSVPNIINTVCRSSFNTFISF